jgi:AraC-like DNA-binding protein
MSGHQALAEIGFEHRGFSVFEGRPDPKVRHRHNEVELAVFEGGSLRAMYGGRRLRIPPDHLVVLWGIMPHFALHIDRDLIGRGIRIPFEWVTRWNLPPAFLQRLVNLEVIVAPSQKLPCSDLAMMQHWIRWMRRSDADGREIVLLEAQARLRRLAADAVAERSPTTAARGNLTAVERVLLEVANHYHEPLSVLDLASRTGFSRNHLMRMFRKATGSSVYAHILDQRVSCAQRLLLTTDMKVLDIAYESGFSSAARFYATFRRVVGQSPTRYRRHNAAS